MGASCSRTNPPQQDALLTAIKEGDVATVQKNLATNPRLSIYLKWADQVSALHVASNEGHLAVLQAILASVKPRSNTGKEKHNLTAFLNRSNSYGQTALMLACKNGHVDCVRYLLEMGADPLVPDKVHSRTCLHYAAWNGWANCISVLLSETTKVRLYNGLMGGAHEAIVNDACGRQRFVDIRSESGFTPLHFAVTAASPAAVKVLLEKGASVMAEVLMGACYSIWPTRSTPLHIAAAKGNAAVVKLLLHAQTMVPGGCPDMRLRLDSNQRRPLDIARQLSHTRLEQMLDPATSLTQAVSSSLSSSRSQGPASLSQLAGKAVQGILLGSLDRLAWQIRLREAQDLGRLPAFMRREKHPSGGGKHKRKKLGDAAPEEREEKPSTVGSTSVYASMPDDTPAAVTEAETASDDPSANAKSLDVDDALSDMREEAEGEAVAVVAKGSATGGLHSECGVCMDRRTELLIGGCSHECCYQCAYTLCKKTRLSRSAIRCPFCRGVISTFSLKPAPPSS